MGKRLTVYIVDDSAVQADIARALLEKAGHSVVTYRSGPDALQDLPAGQPDCIGATQYYKPHRGGEDSASSTRSRSSPTRTVRA